MSECKLELSLNTIQSNLDKVKEILANTKNKSITHIRYSCRREGGDTAEFFIVNKSEVNSIVEAFISLWNYSLHHDQYWNLAESTSQDFDNIVNLWMFNNQNHGFIEGYELDDCTFAPISNDIVLKQINALISWILEEIQAHVKKNTHVFYKEEVGIFVNEEPVGYDLAMSYFKLDEIINAIEIQDEWYDREYLYETPENYVYFVWCTSG